MIIFYDQTGEIKGMIHGRVHGEEHIAIEQHYGQEKLQKLVIQWKPVRFYTKEGKEVEKNHPKVYSADFEPEHEQKELLLLFEKKPSEVYNHRIENNLFIKK